VRILRTLLQPLLEIPTMASSIDSEFRIDVMRPTRDRVRSMAQEGRTLDEITSWLADLPLTDLEYDVAYILAGHEAKRQSPAVEQYRQSLEAGIGA
jgi:hypothetical protein